MDITLADLVKRHPEHPGLRDALDLVFNVTHDELAAGHRVECAITWDFLKYYIRPFNSGMALGLLALFKMPKDADGWVDCRQETIGLELSGWLHKREIEKFPWWGLTEMQAKRNDLAGEPGGFWRVTKLGQSFLRGAATIPAKVTEFLSNPIASSEEKVSFKESLGKHFCLPDLLKASSPDEIVKAWTTNQKRRTGK